MRSLGAALFLLIATCTANNKIAAIEKAFTSYYIVPYLMPTAPPQELCVRYSTEVVNLGNKIPAYAASIPPYIYYEAFDDTLYTIIIVDIDFPSAGAPIDAQYLHALIVNIRGNNLTQADYITPYTPINPYPGSGYHRIVILLFRQARRIDINNSYFQNLNGNLTKFSVQDFATQYRLGDATAGNFFLSQLTICEKVECTLGKCKLCYK